MPTTLTAKRAREMIREIEPVGRSVVSPTLSKRQAKTIYEAALSGLPDMYYLPCGLAKKIEREFGEQIVESRLLERDFEASSGNGRGTEYWKSGGEHSLCVKFLDGKLLNIEIVQGAQVVRVRRDLSLSELDSLHSILG